MSLWRRIIGRLRGPHVPIVLVLIMLFLHYTRYREVIDWKWPVEDWTMYRQKAPTAPKVSYRRFLLERAGGEVEAISLGRAAGFLDQPYRLGSGLGRNQSAFLITCLRILRESDPGVVGLRYERRTWRYAEEGLQAHLSKPATWTYRVRVVPSPEAGLRAPPQSADLLQNGRFAGFERRSGNPKGWRVDGASVGVGVEPTGDERTALLSAGPRAQTLSQQVALPPGASAEIDLQAEALLHTVGDDVVFELKVADGNGTPLVASTRAIADGAWHRLRLSQRVRRGGRATVRVRAGGSADVFVDDVSLRASAPPP